MIYVAFHYRLPTDTTPDAQGAWKEFNSLQSADKWLSGRMGKTKTSPNGAKVFPIKNIQDVPADASKWLFYDKHPISLQKAIQSYVSYCNQKKSKQNA